MVTINAGCFYQSELEEFTGFMRMVWLVSVVLAVGLPPAEIMAQAGSSTLTGFPDAPPPLEETGGPQVKAISGSALPGISKWALSYGGEYVRPATVVGLAGELFGAVDASYRASYSSSASASKYLVIDGYSVVNARVGFRWKDGWTLSLCARNLLDKDYFELLSAAHGNSGLYVGLPGDPRSFGLTMRMNFR